MVKKNVEYQFMPENSLSNFYRKHILRKITINKNNILLYNIGNRIILIFI